MLRKALVAGVAVVVSLLTVSYFCPTLSSHVRLWIKERHQEARDSVSVEQEISRLKMEVKRLEAEDDRHFDKVAKQVVEVKKLEKEVAAMKVRLDKDLVLIRARKTSLVGEERFVTYEGQKFDRSRFNDELRALASRFQVEEEELKSKEEQLALRQANLELNRKKLSELRLTRQKLITRLELLETRLVRERTRQAVEASTIDDANYSRVSKDVDRVEERLSVNEEKQKLKGEVNGPVRAAEERKQKEAAIDEFLKDPRFNEKGDKQ
jgi:hypothetical protein